MDEVVGHVILGPVTSALQLINQTNTNCIT